MRVFLGFVRKEVFHVLRDRRTLLVLIGLPVVWMCLFGFALRNEVEHIATVVVDPAPGPLSRHLTSAVDASSRFERVASTPSMALAERMLQSGQARLVIALDRDLEAAAGRIEPLRYQIVVDGSDPNTARTMVAYARALVESTLGRSLAERSSPGGVGNGMPAPRIDTRVHMAFNRELDSAFLFVPGLIVLVLTLVSALMTSVTLAREKELGTMEVLLVSPLRPFQIIAGKVVPYLGLSVLNVLVILALAKTVFGVPMRGSFALLLAECTLFILCALALGVLVSAHAETQQAATTASMASLMFPTILLTGFIFPLASMPAILQWISLAVPGRWFLEIVRGILLKGLSLGDLWRPTAVLAAMTTLLLILSVRSFRVRLDG
jgi:ABC-2 type transport system permease protein